MSDDLGYNEATQVSTMKETDRKCPACGGTMDFDPATGGLSCPYCGHKEAIAVEENCAMEQDIDTADQTGNMDWGTDKKTVICKSCGAESIYDALQVADICPYCGSNQVMEAKDEHTMAPGGVCPFLIDAKQAVLNFKNWIKNKLFCPSKAKKLASPEKMKGVYLPFWTFDTETNSEYSGRYGKNRTEEDSEGNTRTVTDWYRVSGWHDKFVDDFIEPGTNRHESWYLRGLGTFDTANNKSYKPEYVAGFLAERYSIGLKNAWETAKGVISGQLRSEVEAKIRYEHNADVVNLSHFSVNFSAIKFKYLLLPVWISVFRYKDKLYKFYVNGQTGQVSGKAPVSPLRVAIAVVIVLALAYLFYRLSNG